MKSRAGFGPAVAATAALIGAATFPLRITEAASLAPFDACRAVDVRTAAGLIGGPIEKGAPNFRQSEWAPRESSSCSYQGAHGGQLTVLLLRSGPGAKERASLATFRSSYERTATAQYGKPVTRIAGDAAVVAFSEQSGEVLDVAAFTNEAGARVTLTFGKARASDLEALALSLVRATYGAGPTAPPSSSPDIAPCGRRSHYARYHG